MKYTAEEFKNARFATRHDGRFAARVDQGDTALNWVVNEHSGYGWRTDAEMAENDWKPVSVSRRITDSEVKERLKDEGIAYMAIFNKALRWAGVKVHPDPKPELPTAPGSVVKVRVPGYGVQHIVLGKDRLWRGPNVKAEASHVLNSADVVEVIA